MSADIGSHVLCHNWARKSNEKVMSLTLKVIFLRPILATKTFSSEKTLISPKKDTMPWDIFRFFGKKYDSISHLTSVNGKNHLKKMYFF